MSETRKNLTGPEDDPLICQKLQEEVIGPRKLIIAANRGPVTFHTNETGEAYYQRGGGGLVTALLGLAKHVDATWIASAQTDEDRAFLEGEIPIGQCDERLRISFITPGAEAYDKYYGVIANPLLWFLQHGMWDTVRSPTITRDTWDAWQEGYVRVNELFARAIAAEVMKQESYPSLVMLQDYHLYLVPRQLREQLPPEQQTILTHFIHIPWPGAEDWGILPPAMRKAILDGLLAVDLLGFQTRDDGMNFIRTCESHLPSASVSYKQGRIWYRNHSTHVRDFPISIDVDALREEAHSDEVQEHLARLELRFGGRKLIVRIDRTEPSKNIVRGFLAFDQMLELYPDYRGKVQFVALLVPSRIEVDEYMTYLDEINAAAGRINARYGDSDWEPVRVMVGENYPRAVALLQMYDILLVNSVADGMNLVAKEGPVVNERDGVVILSERTGAHQQLSDGALVISPWDVYATAQALHQAFQMSPEERRERANRLRWRIEREDIHDWLCRQLSAIRSLNLLTPSTEGLQGDWH